MSCVDDGGSRSRVPANKTGAEKLRDAAGRNQTRNGLGMEDVVYAIALAREGVLTMRSGARRGREFLFCEVAKAIAVTNELATTTSRSYSRELGVLTNVVSSSCGCTEGV